MQNSAIFVEQPSTPIEPSASDHEPKGEGGGKTYPQKVNNAPTLKGPKSSPITLVLAISSSSSSMHFFLALPHFLNRDLT